MDEESYGKLITLWTSGVREYHRMASTYLTANSILVAATAIILRINLGGNFLVSLLFSILGVFICVQMVVALSRFRATNVYWERNLRIIEGKPKWTGRKLFKDLYNFREKQKSILSEGDEPELKPNFGIEHFYHNS